MDERLPVRLQSWNTMFRNNHLQLRYYKGSGHANDRVRFGSAYLKRWQAGIIIFFIAFIPLMMLYFAWRKWRNRQGKQGRPARRWWKYGDKHQNEKVDQGYEGGSEGRV
ncbi:hypothetical protein HBI71_079150 [Parastagonospora nodorum]|nr:hypothetical protein HBI71_079150 [Parastagonospora nodorum]